jgi:hypothetical protein
VNGELFRPEEVYAAIAGQGAEAGHELDPELLQAGQPAPHLVPRLRPRHGDRGSLVRAIQRLGLDKNKVCIVSGIGCSSRAVGYLDFDTLHTAHGRALAFATGIKLSRPELKVVVMTGDGDCTAIGGNHFIHAARRNIDITTIVMNNSIYGMTSGQYSPMTPKGMYGTTAPYGNLERELRPLRAREGGGRDLRRPRDLLPRAPPHRPHRVGPAEQGLFGGGGPRPVPHLLRAQEQGGRPRRDAQVDQGEHRQRQGGGLPAAGEGGGQEAHRRALQRAGPRVHRGLRRADRQGAATYDKFQGGLYGCASNSD